MRKSKRGREGRKEIYRAGKRYIGGQREGVERYMGTEREGGTERGQKERERSRERERERVGQKNW